MARDAAVREIQTAIVADPGDAALHARLAHLLESASSPLAELARIEVALLTSQVDRGQTGPAAPEQRQNVQRIQGPAVNGNAAS